MKTRSVQIVQEVKAVYQWIEEQLAHIGQTCKGCGDCCDFEAFGHRLYITTPELIFFQHPMESQVKAMTNGICPYRIDGRCSVYPHRFSGCRIFSCKGDPEKENALYEKALKKFKALCDEYKIPYHYVSLRDGLVMLSSNDLFKIKN
jgi:Fe-S-cluster containining protein